MLLTVAVTAMVVTAFSLPLGLLVRDLARDRAVSAVQRETNTVARTLAVLGNPSALQMQALIEGRSADVEMSIVTAGGEILGNGPVDPALVAQAREGVALSAAEDGGEALYVPVVSGTGVDLVVRGWVGPSRLSRNVGTAWAALAGLAALLVGIAALLADRLGRSMVRPVEALAEAADRLGTGALDVSVQPSGPVEVRAVGAAFNRLVSRVGELVAREREEVADLSHRLRTPLAALQLDAEALGDVPGAEEVRSDVAYLERAVDRLIDEARRPIRDAGGAVTDLVAVVRDRAAIWAPLAAEQERAFAMDLPDDELPVAAADHDLEAMVDALLGNIIAHTSEGTSFRLRVHDGRVPELIVEDDGRGFADLSVVERGVSGAGGTGLGLDIVRRTAEQTGGSLELGNRPEGGARIRVRFGPVG